MTIIATDSANTPSKGLSLEEAVAQLKANRGQAQDNPDHLEDGDVEVVDEDLDLDEEEEDFDTEDTEDTDEDSEGDDQDDDSEESEGEDGESEPEVWEIDIEGETVEVTTEELHKGYLRHNDYTRKRQADAKNAKDLETEYATKISQLTQALQQNVSNEERQLAQLNQQYQQAPDDASKRNIHYQMLQLQQNVATRKAALKQTTDLQQQNAAAKAEAYWAEQENILKTQYEDWDTKKEELVGYLTSQGFQDLSMFAHADMASIVDKARQFDDLQQKRKTVVNKKIRRKVPKVLKAGQGEKKFNRDSNKIKALQARFNKTGSIKDAQALLQSKRGK